MASLNPPTANGTTNGDLPLNPAKHKLVEQVVRTPGRQPSPQPTMLGVPGATHSNQSLHKILSDHSSGYIAPQFEGKKAQMEEGECITSS
jgi:glutamate dehydrogenase